MDNTASRRVDLARSITELARILPSYDAGATGFVIAQGGAAMDNTSACIAAATLLGRRFEVADPRFPPEALPEGSLILAPFHRHSSNVDLRRSADAFTRAAKGSIVVLTIVGNEVEAAAQQIRSAPGTLAVTCHRH